MDIIKKNIKKIMLTFFILVLTYAIFFPIKAYDVGYTSDHLYANIIEGTDERKNWFCIESDQHVANYFNGYIWKLTKKITKTSDDGDAWHLMGRIAYWCSINDKQTFDYEHDVNHNYVSKWSYSNAGQAMMWQLLNEYKASFKIGGLNYSAGPACAYCPKYTAENKATWLNDGYKYTVNIDVWENQTYSSAQKLIHVTVSREKKIQPITLKFYKTATDGKTGISGAKLTVNSKTLTSAGTNGEFGSVKFTPTSSRGSFKVKLNETAPKGYLGIPTDVILTVTYNNGNVTRTKGRNIKR